MSKILQTLRRRAILLTYHGSKSYGTVTDASDTDMVGIIAPTLDEFFGFEHAETWRCEESVDLWAYSIRKFFHLAVTANPNVVQILFQDHHIKETWHWRYIKSRRRVFLGRDKVEAAFLGFARGTMKKIHSRGYSPKLGQHLLRGLLQCEELLHLGKMTLPLPAPFRERIMEVKRGEVGEEEVLAEAEQRMNRIPNLPSPLPNEANRQEVEELLRQVHYSIYVKAKGKI